MIKKQIVSTREVISRDLYIPDLVDMERTGNYDRHVLLWMQEAYAQRAIAKSGNILAQLNATWAFEDEPSDRIRQKQIRGIQDVTCDLYDIEKQSGGGADLKSYIDAAKAMYAAECAWYGIQLHEVAECIRIAIENVRAPDFDRSARIAYIAMSKMSVMMNLMEGICGKDDANKVSMTLSNAIKDINGVMGGSKRLGRELLLSIEQISMNPQQYLEFREFSDAFDVERGPWEYETGQRNDYEHIQ